MGIVADEGRVSQRYGHYGFKLKCIAYIYNLNMTKWICQDIQTKTFPFIEVDFSVTIWDHLVQPIFCNTLCTYPWVALFISIQPCHKKLCLVLQANIIAICYSKVQIFLQRGSASPYLATKNHYSQHLFVSFPEETKLLLSAMSPAVLHHHKFQNQPVTSAFALPA